MTFPRHWTGRVEQEKFLAAYIECALWSSTDESDRGDPLDENYSSGLREVARASRSIPRCGHFGLLRGLPHMTRFSLLLRLLRCHEAETNPVRRIRLALVILRLEGSCLRK